MSQENGAGESSPDTGGLAIDLAMEEARANPSLHGHVAAFLDNQNSLIDIQKHHLREQLKQLHLGIWEKQLGVLLRLATAVVGIAFAAGFALMVWDAAHSTGLLIEPFAVPPDLAGKGLSGQVIAGQVLDKLTTMQNQTESPRTAQSYANNWGSDIKVEIPQTGVSIGEFRRFLREWLGHDTHISGEVFRTATGIAVTARAGAQAGATFTGADSELDALVQKAAEHVYDSTQPYRFANWLDRNVLHPGTPVRIPEAISVYRRLIENPDPVEKAWAWNGLGTIAWTRQNSQLRAIDYYRKAVAAWPDFTIGHYALGYKYQEIGHLETALAEFRIASALLHRSSVSDLNPLYLPSVTAAADMTMAGILGDYAAMGALARQGAALPDTHATVGRGVFLGIVGDALSNQHDGPGLRAWLHAQNIPPGGSCTVASVRRAAQREDWVSVAAWEACAEKAFAQTFPGYDIDTRSRATVRPLLALAKAKLGDIQRARAVIATVQPDSYQGIRVRAQFAALAGEPSRADYWFARAVAAAPSIPFAYLEWGQTLMARGDADGAIAKFQLANQKGPHFADPLEMWGEALMAQNKSHLALAKFAEAEKYAPNWGRLHLKWGQALAYAGNKDEARKQFSRSATLDLTPAEKSELARTPRP